jgi:hypothetical protein
MSAILNTYGRAELALAAYSELTRGNAGSDENVRALQGGGMSLKQAQEFALRYPEVIAQVDDVASGFSVTVFRDARRKKGSE